jgi:hypothetical protein
VTNRVPRALLAALAIAELASCSKELARSSDPVASSQSALVGSQPSVPRIQGVSVQLNDGRLLYAGGNDATNTARDTVEIYDPLKDAWSTVAPLPSPIVWGVGALLKNGEVFVGDTLTSKGTFLYDPVSDQWSSGPAMSIVRTGGAAVELPDGGVLVAGSGTSEVYDRLSNAFVAPANMGDPRVDFNIATLASGKVLVSGGHIPSTSTFLATNEIYDPDSNSWMSAAPVSAAVGSCSLVLLPNDRVYLFASAVTGLYNEGADSWTSGGGGSWNHTATRLPTGNVLIAGGGGGTNGLSVYNSTSNTMGGYGTLAYARYDHVEALLPTGRVLLMGGLDAGNALQPNEIYNPFGAGSWSPVSNMNTARLDASMVRLPDGRVLVVGGEDGSGNATATAEIYDPTSRTWTLTDPLPVAASLPSLVTLHTGEVLAFNASGSWLYNPNVTPKWRPAAPTLVHPRSAQRGGDDNPPRRPSAGHKRRPGLGNAGRDLLRVL